MISVYIFQNNSYCYYCGKNKIDDMFLCNNCLSRLDRVDNHTFIMDTEVFYPYFYDDIMKNMIRDYKFERITAYAHIFSEMILQFDKRTNLFKDYDYLLPAPMHEKKKRKRGFDHIRLISDMFIKETNLIYFNSLIKSKSTKSQHDLNKFEREDNLKEAFEFKDDKSLEGKSILIFDDIVTTGNTLREIREVLYTRNPKKVSALTLTSSGKVI